MPNRILRESILTSDRVNQLDAAEEVFYRHLMSVVDDYGRYDGRPGVLKAACFPLRLDKVREADCSRWMAACQKAGLIVLYEIDSKPYLQLLNLGAPRAKSSKYPAPRADENICAQTRADVPYSYSSSGSYSDSNAHSKKYTPPTPSSAAPTPSGAAASPGGDAGFVRFWETWPKHHRKTGRAKCAAFWKKHRLEPLTDRVIRALRACMASHDWVKESGAYIPKPMTWLHDTPWESDEADFRSGPKPGPLCPEDDIEGLTVVYPSSDEIDRLKGWGKYANNGNGETEVSQ